MIKVKNYTLNLDFNDPDKILEIYKLDGKVLKSSKRSLVKLVNYRGYKIVVKEPRYQNKRKRFRLLSLFSKSEAQKALDSMELLNKNGIPTNKPLVSYEKRKFGMVEESFELYEHLEGEVVTSKHARDVISLLKKIHNLGYVHNDTQVRNFIFNENQVYTIDCKLIPKTFGKISEYSAFIGFAVDIKEALKYINQKSFSYKIAYFFYLYFRFFRRTKKKIRLALNLQPGRYKETLNKKERQRVSIG